MDFSDLASGGTQSAMKSRNQVLTSVRAALGASALWCVIAAASPLHAQTADGRRSVSGTVELQEALKAGVRIISLQPGSYPDVRIEGLRSAAPIIITAADAKSPPVVHRLSVSDASNIVFDRLEFRPQSADAADSAMVELKTAANIEFRRISMLVPEAMMDKRFQGMVISGSTGVRVSDSVFEGLERAVAMQKSSGLTIEHNRFGKLGAAAIGLVECSDVSIIANRAGGFRPEVAGTPSFVQSSTRGAAAASRNIKIADNVLIQDTPRISQGVVFGNEARIDYEMLQIAGNIIVLGGPNGLTVERGRKVVIERNILLDPTGANFNNAIRVFNVADGSIAGNMALAYAMRENQNVVVRLNATAPRLATRTRELFVNRLEEGLAGRGSGRIHANFFVTATHRAAGPRS
jgi:hypothetical protein